MFHTPVLLSEVIKYLSLKKNGHYIDCNLGGGGHAKEILKGIAPNGRLLGIDMDIEATKAASINLKSYKERVVFKNDNFRDLSSIASKSGFNEVDGILFDLGLSSHQLEFSGRGFTFKKEEDLDMRFCKNSSFTSAKEILNEYDFNNLRRIFREYGELSEAPRLAGAILRERTIPIETTFDLIRIVKKVIPKERFHYQNKYFAKVFQALRIETNQEMANLKKALISSVSILKKNGRLVVLSYHSIEDRIVKKFFNDKAKTCECPPESPLCVCHIKPELEIITKKVVTPTKEEVARNNKSRSAKLRAAKKI